MSCVLVAMAVPALAAPDYEREIAPILRTYCAGCHNDRDAESEFSVERFASLRKGGAEAGDPIAPADAAASVLIQRILSKGADHMPPDDEPQVPAADSATLEAWIAAGAPGPAIDASILETLTVPALPAYPGTKPVTAAALSPDGSRLAVVRGRSIEIMAIEKGRPLAKPLATIKNLPGKVAAVHFTRDGTKLVMAAGIVGLRGVAEIRDVATGKVVQEFGGHHDLLYDAALSPDEKTLATAGYDRSIKLWNVADGSLERSIDVHNGAVFDLAWHPSGKLFASASADETIKLWRASDGVRLDTLSQPQGEVTSVAFTPDGGHVIGAGRDKRIHIWKLVSLDAPAINPPLHSRFAHEAPIVALTLSADGRRLVTTAEDRSVKTWTVPDLVLEHDFAGQSDLVAAVVPQASGGFLLGRMDGSLDRLDVADIAAPVAVAAGPRAAGAAITAESNSPAADIPVAKVSEAEPNDEAQEAQVIVVPTLVSGSIGSAGDADCFRFAARAGQPLVLEVIAASGNPKSALDSRIEILDTRGEPVQQVVLQAVRDSWITFRGKNSTISDDFRVQNWEEMELDEYLYLGGEVVKLWRYPRGPDSGFMVYPGFGSRHTFFHTSAITHALNEPAWIVEPLPPGTTPVPNGLPVFPIPYENDDEPTRRLGTDSHLIFKAPSDGEYVARVTDVRGFGGSAGFHYTLGIREPKPSLTVGIDGKNPKVSPGSGRELLFTATRIEGYEGPVRIEIDHVPTGFTFHGPIEIEAGQRRAFGVLSAAEDAPDPDAAADQAVRVRAVATVEGREVVKDLGTLGDIQLGGKPKVTVEILPSGESPQAGQPLEFVIRPGETITARVRATRHDFKGRIEFGQAEAGRNLPHGVFVDNIGLSGLLIVEGQDEREFFITAAPKAKPGQRLFHLRAGPDGGQVSLPARITIR